MTIETKYNIGDEVWVNVTSWKGDYPRLVKVCFIDCLIYKNMIGGEVANAIIYRVEGLDNDSHDKFHEFECFPTKEELLKSL